MEGEKLKDVCYAHIYGTNYIVRIELWNQFNANYAHIDEYNVYHAVIVDHDVPDVIHWELPEVSRSGKKDAQRDVELLYDAFGGRRPLEWQDY